MDRPTPVTSSLRSSTTGRISGKRMSWTGCLLGTGQIRGGQTDNGRIKRESGLILINCVVGQTVGK